MTSALVVEGGAMRGIFAAGVLDCFLERGVTHFDFAIGVSAGATNLSTYVTGAKGLSKTIIMDYATRREFFSPLRFIRGGHMTDVHWLWHYSKATLGLPSPEKPSTPLYVGITNADTGSCEYPRIHPGNVDDIMVASCAIPTAYRDQPVIHGSRFVDGGVADPIPVQKAWEMGARDITVVLSQSAGFRKPEIRSPWLLQKLYGAQPALMNAMLQRAGKYNASLDFIQSPPEGCHINVIAPSASFAVKRLTMDKKKLLRGYAEGKRAGRRESKSAAA